MAHFHKYTYVSIVQQLDTALLKVVHERKTSGDLHLRMSKYTEVGKYVLACLNMYVSLLTVIYVCTVQTYILCTYVCMYVCMYVLCKYET